MKENYIISITGTQTIGNEQNKMEFTTLGSYYIKNNTKYIIYKEYDPDFPNEKSSSVITVQDNNLVTLIDKDIDRAKLIIEQGKRHICYYDTGFGDLTLGVFTDTVKVNLDENGGTLTLHYTIDFNSDVESVNELYIEVKNKNNGGNLKNAWDF